MRYVATQVKTSLNGPLVEAVLDTTDGSTALFGDAAEQVAEEFNAGLGVPPFLYIWREAGFWEEHVAKLEDQEAAKLEELEAEA